MTLFANAIMPGSSSPAKHLMCNQRPIGPAFRNAAAADRLKAVMRGRLGGMLAIAGAPMKQHARRIKDARNKGVFIGLAFVGVESRRLA